MPPTSQLFAALSGAEPPALPHPPEDSPAEHGQHMAALVELGRALVAAGYDWVCPSAETQALVNGRFVNRKAYDLAGVFGWNRPGEPDVLLPAISAALLQTLVEAGVLQVSLDRETVRSRVRFSSFAGTLVAHSAWPTHDPDAVAFGPDTYRFGAFVERELGTPVTPLHPHLHHHERPRTVVDLGCQSGAAGVLAARLLEHPSRSEEPAVRVLFTDPNPRALRFATANARLSGLSDFACLQTETLADAPGALDLVLAHPPFQLPPRHAGVMSAQERMCTDWGTDSALRMVESALHRLAPGGRLLLCTGAPVVRGVDQLWHRMQALLAQAGVERHAVYRYQMLEPDVSSTLLAQPAYAEVERIAAVGLSVLIPHPR